MTDNDHEAKAAIALARALEASQPQEAVTDRDEVEDYPTAWTISKRRYEEKQKSYGTKLPPMANKPLVGQIINEAEALTTPTRIEADARVTDIDRRRVVTLAKLGLMLSTMASEGMVILGHDDSTDLYNDVLMALAIEDADYPDIALEVARDHPDGHLIIDRVAHHIAPSESEIDRDKLNRIQDAVIEGILSMSRDELMEIATPEDISSVGTSIAEAIEKTRRSRKSIEASHPQEAVAELVRPSEFDSDWYRPKYLADDIEYVAPSIRTITPPIQAAESGLLDEAVEALRELEDANDRLAATRSQATYDAMIMGDGSKPQLEDLDAARLKARTLLAKAGKPGEAGNG